MTKQVQKPRERGTKRVTKWGGIYAILKGSFPNAKHKKLSRMTNDILDTAEGVTEVDLNQMAIDMGYAQ